MSSQESLLSKIQSPEDLRKLPKEKLLDVCVALRERIIDVVSKNGGHLGASLGVVELSVALHYAYNTPEDILVWDVGHQAYGHKILTGRNDSFDHIRKSNGPSGFPKRSESIYDAFGVGHAGTSISAVLGMALSAVNNNSYRQHIAVIGDASIASGMAFEALNHAGSSQANITLILNDNAIGIDHSVGALKNLLFRLKSEPTSPYKNWFKDLSIDYIGPIDGHDLPTLLTTLESLKSMRGPRLLHIVTTKGKGLIPAEQDQITYHAPGKFDKLTGSIFEDHQQKGFTKFQDVFGETILELAEKNPKIYAITPAMPTGSSLKQFIARFPERAFDVGIAEQHAVTLSAGLAAEENAVYCTIYSTFLQRGYDQVIHDVVLQKLPVIFCVDRAGLVGRDGATHQGVYDVAFLKCLPDIVLAAASNEVQLRNLLYTAQRYLKKPFFIRYPRGYGKLKSWKQAFKALEIGKAKMLKHGEKIAVISSGIAADEVKTAIDSLPESLQKWVGHIDLVFIKPLDEMLLKKVFDTYEELICVEENSLIGGVGESILSFKNHHNFSNKIHLLGVPDIIIDHASVAEQRKQCGIDAESIAKLLLDRINALV